MEATESLQHRRQSLLTMISYGFGFFIAEFIGMAFGAYVFYFYEVEMGLDTILASAGYIIYAIWNAINDPFIGYITNRKTRFYSKFGRRFPWIIMGVIPTLIAYILIFTPPAINNDVWLFIWLVFTTCLFDTAFSLWDVNMRSIFPDKFRGNQERRNASGVCTVFGVIGIALGSLVPPMVVEYDDLRSYLFQGIIVGVICIVCFILMLHGVREDRDMIERYAILMKEKPQSSFMQIMRKAFKHRNFIVFLLFYLFYETLANSMTGSANYIVDFVLGMEADAVTLIMAGFLAGSLISIPFWMWISRRLNNNAMMIVIGGIGLTLTTIPFQFINDYTLYIVCFAIWGIFLGMFWMMLSPVFSDIIDELVVITQEREEGVYMGIRLFFGRLALVTQIIIFAVVHELTGFIEGGNPMDQPASAIFGIHLHSGLIPALVVAIATLIFWRFYDLKPTKVAAIQQKLKELNL